MLYKRALRKEKEVITFLIKDRMVKLAWNLSIEPHIYQSKATDWALVRGQAVSLPLTQVSRSRHLSRLEEAASRIRYAARSRGEEG